MTKVRQTQRNAELYNVIGEVIKHIEEAHSLLNEVEGNKYQSLFIKSIDSYLAHALNDAHHLETKL